MESRRRGAHPGLGTPPGKALPGSKLTLLGALEFLCRREGKMKAALETLGLSVEGEPNTHTGPSAKTGKALSQASVEISVQPLADHRANTTENTDVRQLVQKSH